MTRALNHLQAADDENDAEERDEDDNTSTDNGSGDNGTGSGDMTGAGAADGPVFEVEETDVYTAEYIGLDAAGSPLPEETEFDMVRD